MSEKWWLGRRAKPKLAPPVWRLQRELSCSTSPQRHCREPGFITVLSLKLLLHIPVLFNFYYISYGAFNFDLDESTKDACTTALTTVGGKGDVTENMCCATTGSKSSLTSHLNTEQAFLTMRTSQLPWQGTHLHCLCSAA